MTAFTIVLTRDDLRSALADLLRMLIGVIWLIAAVQKLRMPTATQDSVRRLLSGPRWAIPVVARVIPVVEILLGLALLVGWRTRLAAVLSAGLFLLFAVMVGIAAVRGALDGAGCGCFGTGAAPQDKSATTGLHALPRNLVLAAVAVAVASES